MNPSPDTNSIKVLILLTFIDSSFLKIEIQRTRINDVLSDVEPKKLSMLFGDIHFYLISTTNLYKCLKELLRVIPNDTQLKKIINKYKTFLEIIKTLRDHLEHILDGRLDGKGYKGKPLREPGMLGNLDGDVYNFGGDKINLMSSFKELYYLKSDLTEWRRRALAHQDR